MVQSFDQQTRAAGDLQQAAAGTPERPKEFDMAEINVSGTSGSRNWLLRRYWPV
jgi:hypothetical protein